MSSIAILLQAPVFDNQSAYQAYQFAQAVIDSDHDLIGVFLYQSGVSHANGYIENFSDEFNGQAAFRDLAQEHKVPLLACVTAANRRGVLDEKDARDRDINGNNWSIGFESVGLGELVQLLDKADRVVQFK